MMLYFIERRVVGRTKRIIFEGVFGIGDNSGVLKYSVGNCVLECPLSVPS